MELENIRWVKYIERPFELFTVSLHNEAYRALLPVIIDRGYTAQAYVSDGRTTELFRDEQETAAFKAHLLSLVKENPEKLDRILEQGAVLNEQTKIILDARQFPFTSENLSARTIELVLFFQRLFCLTTEIPYTIGTMLEEHNILERYQALAVRIKRFRSVSYYPLFKERIITKHFGQLAATLNEEQPALFFKLTVSELLEVLAKPRRWINIRKRAERRTCFVYIQLKDKLHLITDERECGYIRDRLVPQSFISPSILMGIAVYPGKVRAPATIVISPADLHRFREGNILVTIASNPALLPAIGKAAALIADEGGLLSHTAVLARELKKPRIIGTKHATRLLKDGDIIELDAENGFARKIL